MWFLDEMFSKKVDGRKSRPTKSVLTKEVAKKSDIEVKKTTNRPHSSKNLPDDLGASSSKDRSTSELDDVRKSRVPVSAKVEPKLKEKRPWFRISPRIAKKAAVKSSSTVPSNAELQKRPTSLVSKFDTTSARGQNPKLEGDDLSRTSSVTNLEADQKSSKGAKPRKTSSRDRIDKIVDSKKNEKKGLGKNNNKLDSTETPPFLSLDSALEEDLQQLRRQLQEMAQEKTDLALQLGEKNGQVNFLQKENYKLKSLQEECNIQLEKLSEDNTALRNRLRDVAHSPLSDNEKQQLLFESHRHHNSAPASIATNILDDGNGADTTCTTPDWDKHSSGNISEVSVACLQDKINQMQETHYSTNEELQATLQELTDLQMQLTELRQENERLNDEKALMFDSLCRQTERLNGAREDVETLRQRLSVEQGGRGGDFDAAAERERDLVGMLHEGQAEREAMMAKIEQLSAEARDAGEGAAEASARLEQTRERVGTLESALDAKHAEHRQLELELVLCRDQCSGRQIEVNRLTDLLDNARTKIVELEQDRTLSDKSELDELLDNARKEKDSLESEVAHLKEQLAISRNEIEKLKEQVSVLQEECKVTRNNAKTTQSDLEYKCEILLKEKNAMADQLQEFQGALNELQVQSQCQLEDKRQLSTVLAETQRNLSEAERKHSKLEQDYEELKKTRDEENEEWEKFQDDLLTSVRVANDFKTEAQQELQRLILENKSCRERERQLKAEIEKLKGSAVRKREPAPSNMDALLKRPSKNRNKSTKSPTGGTLPKLASKTSRQKRLKTLSVEEETLLKSLRSYNIDHNIPEANLTEEERVIKKLKKIFEDDFLMVKPIAPKPKHQLAISKPLLDSVMANPKLLEVMRDPKVQTIDDAVYLVDRARAKSHDYGAVAQRISVIGRSYSNNHVNQLEDHHGRQLYRTVEAEDLTQEVGLKAPSDSASNRRYSDFSLVVHRSDERVSYATLERIAKSIPADAPEPTLTKEQRFAAKLLRALEEGKHTLRKNGEAKNLPISRPTLESVIGNPKLREVLLDPEVAGVRRRNSDALSPPRSLAVLRQSKSYDDINFVFDVNGTSSRSSSETLSGAEFDVVTGVTGPYNPRAFGTARLKDLSALSGRDFGDLPGRAVSELESGSIGVVDSLTFNETLVFKRNCQKNNTEEQLVVEEESSARKESNENILNPVKNPEEFLAAGVEPSSIVNADTDVDSLTYNDTMVLKKNYQKKNAAVQLVVEKESSVQNEKVLSQVESPEEFLAAGVLSFNPTWNECERGSGVLAENLPRTIARDDLISDEYGRILGRDSLMYNETINKNTRRKSDHSQFANENAPPGGADNENVDVVEDDNGPLVDKQAGSSGADFLLENSGAPRMETFDQQDSLPTNIDYSEVSKEIFNIAEQGMNPETSNAHVVDNNQEYEAGNVEETNYGTISKENRYGVVPPLTYRRLYKDVVKQIKEKYVSDEVEVAKPAESDSGDEDVDNSFLDFFKSTDVTRSDSVEMRKSSIHQIDEDMEYIFSKYLNARISGIIKQSEAKRDISEASPIPKPRLLKKQMNPEVELPNEVIKPIHSYPTDIVKDEAANDVEDEVVTKDGNSNENSPSIVENSTSVAQEKQTLETAGTKLAFEVEEDHEITENVPLNYLSSPPRQHLLTSKDTAKENIHECPQEVEEPRAEEFRSELTAKMVESATGNSSTLKDETHIMSSQEVEEPLAEEFPTEFADGVKVVELSATENSFTSKDESQIMSSQEVVEPPVKEFPTELAVKMVESSATEESCDEDKFDDENSSTTIDSSHQIDSKTVRIVAASTDRIFPSNKSDVADDLEAILNRMANTTKTRAVAKRNWVSHTVQSATENIDVQQKSLSYPERDKESSTLNSTEKSDCTAENQKTNSASEDDSEKQKLTVEEVELVERVKQRRCDRPVSDINDNDLEFIKRISSSYLYDSFQQNLNNVVAESSGTALSSGDVNDKVTEATAKGVTRDLVAKSVGGGLNLGWNKETEDKILDVAHAETLPEGPPLSQKIALDGLGESDKARIFPERSESSEDLDVVLNRLATTSRTRALGGRNRVPSTKLEPPGAEYSFSPENILLTVGSTDDVVLRPAIAGKTSSQTEKPSPQNVNDVVAESSVTAVSSVDINDKVTEATVIGKSKDSEAKSIGSSLDSARYKDKIVDIAHAETLPGGSHLSQKVALDGLGESDKARIFPVRSESSEDLDAVLNRLATTSRTRALGGRNRVPSTKLEPPGAEYSFSPENILLTVGSTDDVVLRPAIAGKTSSQTEKPSPQNVNDVVAESSVTAVSSVDINDKVTEATVIGESRDSEAKSIGSGLDSARYKDKIVDIAHAETLPGGSHLSQKIALDGLGESDKAKIFPERSESSEDLDAVLNRLATTSRTRALERRSTKLEPPGAQYSFSSEKKLPTTGGTNDNVVLRAATASKFGTRTDRPPSGTRRVKSFAQHFENLSSGAKKKHDPVSSEPLARPNRASLSSVNVDRLAVAGKMSENGKWLVADGRDEVGRGQKPALGASGALLVPPSEQPDAKMEEVPEVEEAAKPAVGNVGPELPASEEGQVDADDQACGPSKPQQSESSIEISEKFEKLDLTRRSTNVDAISAGCASDLNLFHLDVASSCDDSFLNLFKTPEEKAFDAFAKKKKHPRKGYLVDPGEESDDEDDVEDEPPKPKVVDFVPLDEATRPVYAKEPSGYETLEREGAYQVLRAAPEAKRSSFSDAKKVFEALQAQADEQLGEAVARKSVDKFGGN